VATPWTPVRSATRSCSQGPEGKEEVRRRIGRRGRTPRDRSVGGPFERDRRGRVLTGSRLNRDGSNGLGSTRRELNDAALALLASEATPEQLADLGVPAGALALLDRMEAPTYGAALIAVLAAKALEGDRHARRDLLARLWPAPKPVELSAGGGDAMGGAVRFVWGSESEDGEAGS
jgi:hypothetical protein